MYILTYMDCLTARCHRREPAPSISPCRPVTSTPIPTCPLQQIITPRLWVVPHLGAVQGASLDEADSLPHHAHANANPHSWEPYYNGFITSSASLVINSIHGVRLYAFAAPLAKSMRRPLQSAHHRQGRAFTPSRKAVLHVRETSASYHRRFIQTLNPL